MKKKKICLIGAPMVGKTSLVRTFVDGFYSTNYLSTIGVNVDHRQMNIDGEDLSLVIWDLHGDEERQRIKPAYLKGMAGYFLVADGTRKETVLQAQQLNLLAEEHTGEVPFVFLINKSDMKNNWVVGDAVTSKLKMKGWNVMFTSARNLENVDKAFDILARAMLKS